jgi:hypothetical protein
MTDLYRLPLFLTKATMALKLKYRAPPVVSNYGTRSGSIDQIRDSQLQLQSQSQRYPLPLKLRLRLRHVLQTHPPPVLCLQRHPPPAFQPLR